MGACSSKTREVETSDVRISGEDSINETTISAEATWFQALRGSGRGLVASENPLQEPSPSKQDWSATTKSRRLHRGSIVAKKPLETIWHGDIDECVRRIENQANASIKPKEEENTIESGFKGEWLDMLRAIGSDCVEVGSALDMIIIGDFGRAGSALDDEKALTMAIAMRSIGLIGELTVVANLGNSKRRAQLAKGTTNVLGAHDVRVGIGSHGGKDLGEDSTAALMDCPYLADESELDTRSGTELIYGALLEAQQANPPRKVTFVCCSALTDLAIVLRDPRWDQFAPEVVSHVVVMGGTHEKQEPLGLTWKKVESEPIIGRRLDNEKLANALDKTLNFTQAQLDEFGVTNLRSDDYVLSDATSTYFKLAPEDKITWDPLAENNTFDSTSSRYVYETLMTDPRVWFIVVSRYAAAECQLPKSAFDGSSHPVAVRLTDQMRPNLQRLWERVHRTEVERLLMNDKFSMEKNPKWFAKLFLDASAPKLNKKDDIWPYVKGFSEYDGLTTVAAALATHPQLFSKLFCPYKCPDTHTLVIGRDGSNHGISDGKTLSELMHFLMAQAMGPGSGEWFGRLRDHQRPGKNHEGVATDMVMVGDFGKDQDDEKALIMATVMRRIGLISEMTVVTNLGNNSLRARLAKGTLNALGAHDVRVAKGSDGGQANTEIHDYEFAQCPYLAPESELDVRGGHELIFAALAEAKNANHQLTFVLNSALTDMAMALRDPRWEQMAPGVVTHIVLMSGIVRSIDEDGKTRISMDKTASNNNFDLLSAEFVYNRLEGDDRFEIIVVTRYAASACQLPRKAIDGSSHPIANRLTAVEKPSLQKLWQRTHTSMTERKAAKDPLPARCDPAWFRKTYLMKDAPPLNAEDDVWQYIKGFNEYDGLTTVVAATATFPDLFYCFFKPYRDPVTGIKVIGLTDQSKWDYVGPTPPAIGREFSCNALATALERLSQEGHRTEIPQDRLEELCKSSVKVGKSYLRGSSGYYMAAADALGIVDSTKMSELLHDLLVTAFSASRFRKGFRVELRVTPLAETWQLVMLQEPQKGQSSDTWRAVITEPPDPLLPGGTLAPIPVHLNRSTEGVLWRLCHELGDRDEPILADLKLGMRHRKVQGVVAAPYYVTQGAWEYLRKGFDSRPGDVWVTGYPASGNMLIHVIVRSLLLGGDCDAVGDAKYACGITAPLEFEVSRGKIKIPYLDALPASSRVFTSHHSPANLPCRCHGSTLPAGVKCIHIIRDPRDCCVSLFNQMEDMIKCDFSPSWVDTFTKESSRLPWGGWLQQNQDWWEARQAHPNQILWITFEECKKDPRDTVRRIAKFLELSVTDQVINDVATATQVRHMRRILKQSSKLKLAIDKTGKLDCFDEHPQQLRDFQDNLIAPLERLGAPLQLATPRLDQGTLSARFLLYSPSMDPPASTSSLPSPRSPLPSPMGKGGVTNATSSAGSFSSFAQSAVG